MEKFTLLATNFTLPPAVTAGTNLTSAMYLEDLENRNLPCRNNFRKQAFPFLNWICNTRFYFVVLNVKKQDFILYGIF